MCTPGSIIADSEIWTMPFESSILTPSLTFEPMSANMSSIWPFKVGNTDQTSPLGKQGCRPNDSSREGHKSSAVGAPINQWDNLMRFDLFMLRCKFSCQLKHRV